MEPSKYVKFPSLQHLFLHEGDVSATPELFYFYIICNRCNSSIKVIECLG